MSSKKRHKSGELSRKWGGGGSFFGFFRLFSVKWIQKNFLGRILDISDIRLKFLIVCLFPAEKWMGSKTFSAKNGIFWQNDQNLTEITN